jgi:hypothetical protein
MREEIIHLHPAAPAKPPAGQPCNGCGVCCTLSTCPVARLRFLQAHGPCPALVWDAEVHRYRCGLLSEPARHLRGLPALAEPLTRRLMHRWIAAGRGCDCEVDILG